MRIVHEHYLHNRKIFVDEDLYNMIFIKIFVTSVLKFYTRMFNV